MLYQLSQPGIPTSVLFFFFSTFIYFWDRERQSMNGGGRGEGQRERETQNRKQAPGSEPSVQSQTRGSNSRTARSWTGWSRTLNRLCHPGAPQPLFLTGIFRPLTSNVFVIDIAELISMIISTVLHLLPLLFLSYFCLPLIFLKFVILIGLFMRPYIFSGDSLYYCVICFSCR